MPTTPAVSPLRLRPPTNYPPPTLKTATTPPPTNSHIHSRLTPSSSSSTTHVHKMPSSNSISLVRMSPLSVVSWHQNLSQTDGRDKILRLFQYLCKLLRGTFPHHSHLLALETLLASSRQCFRLAKWASVYVRMRTSGLGAVSDIALFGYYVLDNITLFTKAGLLKGDPKNASRRAARVWMVAILASFVGTVKEIMGLSSLEVGIRRDIEGGKKEESTVEDKKRELGIVLRKKRGAMMASWKNAADAVVALGLSREEGVHLGIAGGCGVVSSLIGAWQVWPKYMPTE